MERWSSSPWPGTSRQTRDDFNPGRLAGRLARQLDLTSLTRGVLAEAGPRGNVSIDDALADTLRGRPIAGGGDLDFAAPRTLSGDLQLRSGKSRVAVRGNAWQQGIDAKVELAVASLNDWVPDTAGSLTGNFRVRGAWPKLTIAGAADGKIAWRPRTGEHQQRRVRELHVEATVETPLDPSGKVQVDATQVSTSAGFEFARVSLEASRQPGETSTRARGATATSWMRCPGGSPGGLTKPAGAASCRKLTLDAPDMPGLALRAPARVVYDAGAFRSRESLPRRATTARCARRRTCSRAARSRPAIRSRTCRWRWPMRWRRRPCRASCAAS